MGISPETGMSINPESLPPHLVGKEEPIDPQQAELREREKAFENHLLRTLKGQLLENFNGGEFSDLIEAEKIRLQEGILRANSLVPETELLENGKPQINLLLGIREPQVEPRMLPPPEIAFRPKGEKETATYGRAVREAINTTVTTMNPAFEKQGANFFRQILQNKISDLDEEVRQANRAVKRFESLSAAQQSQDEVQKTFHAAKTNSTFKSLQIESLKLAVESLKLQGLDALKELI